MTKEEKIALKEQKRAARKEARKNGKGIKTLIAEFKAFISRGSVVDMSIGVIIGGAFSAIVTAFPSILMSVCTWGLPGGISGLVTVLPAMNERQQGVAGIGQKFAAADIAEMTVKYAATQGVTITPDSDTFVQWQTQLKSLYTLKGTTWVYNLSAFIDWGSLINAVISFLIIALVLFVILKAVNFIRRKNEQLKAIRLEEHYKRHPEDRPVPAAPAAPKPSEVDLLIEIRDALLAAKKD